MAGEFLCGTSGLMADVIPAEGLPLSNVTEGRREEKDMYMYKLQLKPQ
jgi:hypothetical protein